MLQGSFRKAEKSKVLLKLEERRHHLFFPLRAGSSDLKQCFWKDSLKDLAFNPAGNFRPGFL